MMTQHSNLRKPQIGTHNIIYISHPLTSCSEFNFSRVLCVFRAKTAVQMGTTTVNPKQLLSKLQLFVRKEKQ